MGGGGGGAQLMIKCVCVWGGECWGGGISYQNVVGEGGGAQKWGAGELLVAECWVCVCGGGCMGTDCKLLGREGRGERGGTDLICSVSCSSFSRGDKSSSSTSSSSSSVLSRVAGPSCEGAWPLMNDICF